MSRVPFKNFSERNPITIAVVGLLVLVLFVVLIFNSRNLPVIGDGATYAADFTESAGLRPGDDVDVAGVRVGSVSGVSLKGDHVRVEFRVKDTWLGDRSTAAIRIQTLLGAKYLAVDPLGSGELRTSDTIPLNRTQSPFDVTEAFSQLTTTIDQVDTQQLGDSFQALADAFKDTPDTVKATLTGLSALSQTISSRDQQLQQLLTSTQTVSQTIADRNPQISTLVQDGDSLLTELQARDQAIRSLLQGTVALAQQVQGLVADNQQTLGPALDNLEGLIKILTDNQANLNEALRLLGPYYTLFNDAIGSGPWIDAFLCGLFTPYQGSDNPAGVPNQYPIVPNADGSITAPGTDPTKDPVPITRNCSPRTGGGS